MKTKIILILLISTILFSCVPYTPAYLPSSNQIDLSKYGSFIKLEYKDSLYYEGELIAIDNKNLIILTESEGKCESIPLKGLARFVLYSAVPKDYGVFVPLYSILTFSHGLFGIFTLPINLITTISVAIGGRNAYRYTDNNITVQELKMYARFPQGVPPNVKLDEIKPFSTEKDPNQ